jgi:hypothetical protein
MVCGGWNDVGVVGGGGDPVGGDPAGPPSIPPFPGSDAVPTSAIPQTWHGVVVIALGGERWWGSGNDGDLALLGGPETGTVMGGLAKRLREIDSRGTLKTLNIQNRNS